jgi:hypothetical protein
MALTASGAFDLAVGKTVQRVAAAFTMDLPIPMFADFTAFLVAAQLDTQNQTDLPDGVRDQVGFGTIGGSITIGGRYSSALTIADLFNPDNQASPLWRQKIKKRGVTFSWGIRPSGQAAEPLRKLTGRVTGYTINHDDGTVALNVTDLTTDWASVPELPAVITTPPYNAGLTTEFAMDTLVRSLNGDVSSWPARRSGCLLAVGLRSSMWPEVGTFVGSTTTPLFKAGAFGSAYSDAGQASPAYTLAAPVGATWFVECWVTGLSGTTQGVELRTSSADNLLTVFVDLYADRIVLQGSTTVAVATDGGPHYFAVLFNVPVGSGTINATVWIDGVSRSLSFTGGARTATPIQTGSFGIISGGLATNVTIEAVQWTSETAPTINYPFTPQAVLDRSLNPLTVVPPIATGTSGADVLQQMAGAELGYARRDEYGIFRFSNRHTLAQQAVSRTITAATSLKPGFSTDVGGTTEYDHIQVPYTQWAFGAPTAVYTQTGAKKIPKLQTTVWRQTIDLVAAALDATVTNLPNGQVPTDGNSWYRASTDATGKIEHSGISVSVRQITSSVIEITAVNKTGVDAYLVAPSNYTDITVGTPTLWIGGTPATPGDEALVDVTIGAGTSIFTVASNPYLQDPDAARDLGYHVLNQVMATVRDFTNVSIVPDARIQIADKQFIDDAAGRSKIREYVTVWGWSFNATFPIPGESGGTWEHQLNLRAVGPPGAWIGGVAGRSEGELTTFGY